MTMPTPTTPETAPLTPLERELDRRLETILDEMVASADPAELPPDFTARVMAQRPFAAWELRRAQAWRAPALAASGLVAAGLGLGLAPLWSLGPATAVSVWARLVALAVVRPVTGILSASPLLVDAIGKSAGAAGDLGLVLGGATFLGAATLALALRAKRGAVAHARR